MKKIILFSTILLLSVLSNAKFIRLINPADLNVEKAGWKYERVVFPGGDVVVSCHPDFEECGICPTTDPGQGAFNDPTNEEACDYLMGLADADMLQGNYSGSYYATYHVLGEENDRHYSVIMAINQSTGLIEMTFDRID